MDNRDCIAMNKNSQKDIQKMDILEWISVDEKLPFKDGDSQIMCLVYDKWHKEILVRPYNEYHKCWDNEDKDDFYTKQVGGKITHWMELPSKPICI
jgi:hypothetical protein